LPAAGKTGTSHDGWFAGFTSNLLAVAWVGYDNNQELNLSGARSALPIWTDFMKQATQLFGYDDVQPFGEPPGIASVPIDAQGNPVDENSPNKVRDEAFIEGTEPHPQNPIEQVGGFLNKIFHPGKASNVPAAGKPPVPNLTPSPSKTEEQQAVKSIKTPPPAPSARKKGGLLKKFFSIFKGGGSKRKPSSSPDQNPP
jgi:penicillin-binding protein 1B